MTEGPNPKMQRLLWRLATVAAAMLVAGAIAWAAALSQRQPAPPADSPSPLPPSHVAGSSAQPSPRSRASDAVATTAAARRPETRLPSSSAGPNPWPITAAASNSVGTPQTGALEGGVDVAASDAAHLHVLAPTIQRGFTWGTAELVALLHDSARAVQREAGGATMAVGNLSRPGGGDIPQSVSHNSGRDADIAFFALNTTGGSVRLSRMVHFDDRGAAVTGDGTALHFDVARNWALVRSLLSHPAVVVQWVFVSAALRNMLLDHALRRGEPELLQERARRVMVQPSDSARHADHFHVRIACPQDDRPRCVNGPGRTKMARDAQIDALLRMYRHGSPAEQRYARDMLSLPTDGGDPLLPPLETP